MQIKLRSRSQETKILDGSVKNRLHLNMYFDFSHLSEENNYSALISHSIEMLYFYGSFATFKKFLIIISTVEMKVGLSGNQEGCSFTPEVQFSPLVIFN